MRGRSEGPWDPSDLIRRVVNALDLARQAIGNIVEDAESIAPIKNGLVCEKVIAETAMLLLCVAPIRDLDERIATQLEAIATVLVPCARNQDVLAAICLDPGLARDHACAHALLSRLGYPDRGVDHLLSQSLAMDPDLGPERLPHRGLEQEWLARVWSIGEPPRRRHAALLADSFLGRPMDALGSARLDIYAFTHAVMYASDPGGRRIRLPRSASAIAADAVAALAYSLDANDFDPAAEVLLTWPMLRLTWHPAAAFAFRILAGVEDEVGFLPGSTFDRLRYEALDGEERSRSALATSYHSAYIMGFLCALALRPGRAPPAAVPPARRARGAGAALLHLVDADGPSRCWREPFCALAPRQQDSVAPLLLAIVLRRGRTTGNLGLVREALEIALAHDLVDGPAPRQAAALLRRSSALALATSPGAGEARLGA